MKLTDEQVDNVREQTGLDPLPSEMVQDSGLVNHFGNHTFYADPNGLYVFEQLEDDAGASQATAIKIASVEQVGAEGEAVLRTMTPQATTTTVSLQ